MPSPHTLLPSGSSGQGCCSAGAFSTLGTTLRPTKCPTPPHTPPHTHTDTHTPTPTHTHTLTRHIVEHREAVVPRVEGPERCRLDVTSCCHLHVQGAIHAQHLSRVTRKQTEPNPCVQHVSWVGSATVTTWSTHPDSGAVFCNCLGANPKLQCVETQVQNPKLQCLRTQLPQSGCSASECRCKTRFVSHSHPGAKAQGAVCQVSHQVLDVVIVVHGRYHAHNQLRTRHSAIVLVRRAVVPQKGHV